MTRFLGLAVVGLIAFLILLAEIGRLQEDVEARIENQRYFNAHQ
jgi:hypothetical protein